LLAGPDGSGKTTLLHALASELAPLRSAVYLAHPRLPLGGFWMRLAGELDLEPGYDAKRRVLRRAADLAREGGSLLLLVDDASELPAETLYALIATARSEPGIQLVLARSDTASLAGPLPDDLPVVRIDGAAPRIAAQPEPEPEPAVTALPALTARRRSRERRKRAAWAVGGLLVGLALGTLASVPVWRALQGALAPAAPSAPREVIGTAPSPAEEAPPLAASERALPPPLATPSPRGDAPTAPSPSLRADAPPAAPPPVAAAPSRAAPQPAPASPGAEQPAAARLATAPPAAAPAPAAPPPAAPVPEVAAPAPAAPAPAPATPAPSPPPPAPAPAVSAPAPAAPRPRAGPPALGLLTVTSDSAVRIEVDGRPYGPAPLYGVQLSKGEHRVLAHYPDGAVALKTIYLDAENVSVFFR
jgi:hypothetical protein